MTPEVLVFRPLFMERVWGGRRLAQRYNKSLPPDVPIGESWEIVDREDAQSMVAEGPLQGRALHELWQTEREEIFGTSMPDTARFPLLVKLLDARDTLSVQVHPPARVAGSLGGEPKTEMWYLLERDPGSLIYAGLAAGTTRDAFAAAVSSGDVAGLLHSFHAEPGQCVFMPSGRVHAIGAGNLILEIQQNSDTTYRVFDWNRTGLDGKPRALHIQQSMAAIDFDDIEPGAHVAQDGDLVRAEEFVVRRIPVEDTAIVSERDRFTILFCERGRICIGDVKLAPGQFCLVPASKEPVYARATGGSSVLISTTLP